MNIIENINFLLGIFFFLCYAYQTFYILVPFLKKAKVFPDAPPHKIAVLVAARNEQDVIGQLIESINCQDYPKEFLKIFLVADNCTDATASVARKHGAVVYERFNKEKVGKGYALNFLLKSIDQDFGLKSIDAFIVLDADNVLESNYITEMNKTYSAGYKVLTSYRNSKNYGTNWISSGYALWFLREAKYLNNSRMILGTSCAISGTGFMLDRKLIEERGGWNYFLLTEDIEFTSDTIAKGEKIGYCGTAVLYDEQPTTFKASWNQRLRWAKGFLQVLRHYSLKLIRGIFSKNFTSCYDMFMTIAPAYTISSLSIIINLIGIVIGAFGGFDLTKLIESIFMSLLGGYIMLFIAGLITTVTEWNVIHCSTKRKILTVFTFPLFMATYIPISIVAPFKKVEWSPIKHGYAISVEEIKNV